MADTKGDESVRCVGTRTSNVGNGVAENDKTPISCGSEVDKENARQACQTPVGSLDTSLICKQCKKNYYIKCLKKDAVCYSIEMRADD